MAVAERAGHRRGQRCRGTIQNDILKEYIARGTYIYPPEPSMRLVTDIFEFCASELPRWNTISISGYHMREAGRHGRPGAGLHAGRRHRLRRGGASRAGSTWTTSPAGLSFFFAAWSELFEEVAKFRAARRMWARIMRERFGAHERALDDVPLPRPDGRLVA